MDVYTTKTASTFGSFIQYVPTTSYANTLVAAKYSELAVVPRASHSNANSIQGPTQPKISIITAAVTSPSLASLSEMLTPRAWTATVIAEPNEKAIAKYPTPPIVYETHVEQGREAMAVCQNDWLTKTKAKLARRWVPWGGVGLGVNQWVPRKHCGTSVDVVLVVKRYR